MCAYVYCVGTPYYALADRNGKFRIANVPNGEYTLRVWQESGEILERKVTIRGAETVSLQTKKKG